MSLYNARTNPNYRGVTMKQEIEPIVAWVTKHALTSGIKMEAGKVCHNISSSMFAYGVHLLEHAHGKEWHRTPEAAFARAEEMRKAKIASLYKQIAKLESLTFEIRS